jgi:hypothetical protein
MIKIKDLEFAVLSAEISAILSEKDPELRWYINIEARPRCIDEISWRPRIYAEGFMIEVRQWTRLDQIAIEIKDEQEFIGWDAGYLYVFEHLPMRHNRVAVRGRHGVTFDLSWDAKCDVFFGDDYEEDLNLSIKTPIQFTGVEVRGRNDIAQATRELELHVDINELVVPSTEENAGGGEQVVVFRPKAI